MDADDVSYPHRLREQVAFLASYPDVDLVGCPMLIFGEDGSALGKRLVPSWHEDIVATPAAGFGLAHPTWLVRADWYRRYYYDATALRFEDAELLYRSHRTSRFANLSQVLYGYRELRGGFGKRFKTRLGRIRYLHARSNDSGRGLFYRAATAESVKLAADAVLAASGTRYAMLRLREQRLAPDESQQWGSLFGELTGESSNAASSALERVQA
jgi:hypothetical protein